MDTTDIVMTTRNRPEYLKETLTCLFERTRSPYALHIIDDESSDPHTVPYLLQLYQAGKLASLTLCKERRGLMANKTLSQWLAFSDPFVITADDLLCPDLRPDWLQRGLDALGRHPQIGELDLNHPGAFRVREQERDGVVYCQCVGGTFGFIRRAALGNWHLAHFRRNYGLGDDVQRSGAIRANGWQVGYLADVYCYHIGKKSAASGGEYGGPFVPPTNWATLEPPREHRID